MATKLTGERLLPTVERACDQATNADEVLVSVADAVGQAVQYDGSAWFGTDPATMLATAPTRIWGIEAGHCDSFWQREFHVEDALLFRDLVRRPSAAGALLIETDEQPMRSARYREFLAPQGYGDELRLVMRVGETAWGLASLYREAGRPAFSDREVALVSSIGPTVARALRSSVAQASPWHATTPAPGLLMLDGDAQLLSSNPEAVAWLEEFDAAGGLISANSDRTSWRDAVSPADGRSVGLPPAIFALVAHAQAVADGRERGPARMRLRGRHGRWLVMHASCLAGPGGAAGAVGVVIEPAKSSEIAPIIVEAYALSPRERDIVRGLALGRSTAEIAAELFLSTHTVRDYVKSVLEKVGVSSRAELVAKLFAEHYSDALHAAAIHD